MMNRKSVTIMILVSLALGLWSMAESAETGQQNDMGRYRNRLAIWDAEGQHLNTEEILAIHDAYGMTIYFFRDERKQNLDLERLDEAGILLIKTAHPLYAPFNQESFISDPEAVREWARSAAAQQPVDALALDVEVHTATTHAYIMQVLSEEARKAGKPLHVAPHFSLERWNEYDEHVTVADYNEYSDVVWPWLYNRLGQSTYGEGLLRMTQTWTEAGITAPVYPIFDWGRPHYGGISSAEASEVPAFLHAHGIETACLFQPHISYRDREDNDDYRRLWESLHDHFGRHANNGEAHR